MEIIAKAKRIRMSPRKVRLVVDTVRGLTVVRSLDVLRFLNKKAVEPVVKLLKSAVANAQHNFELDSDNLYIKTITVDEAQTLHRWLPRAHGRATPIRKKSCHINLILDEIKPSGKIKTKQQVIEAPVKLGSQPVKDNKVKIKEEKGKDFGKLEVDDENLSEEKGKVISDVRREGRTGHSKIEGGSSKGFINKMFRRKSG
ncbi:50S ribosomal protein L22 [Patescibacteria group bacterium]|nr:50S ribosomal protein L22 [Patescibacteria group bacterium]MBU0879307.1 50S ribosomal protein L22 [Patescibacteria group bacterium]MBU0880249.1 50S ribosomal protein L22 [Patescibacteria group bacterium]MBU0898128.1 50S ribosomal protein L22 [Patescibacteria group bacterium]MBU1062658.1 50S ribosomal protein L22 [Patescibacteria group bacterium]